MGNGSDESVALVTLPDGWEKNASGKMEMEHGIELSLLQPRGKRTRRGRMDIFVTELGDYGIAVVWFAD